MDTTFRAPRFRGVWAIPAAFASAALVAAVLGILEITGVVILLGAGERDILAQALAEWILPTALNVILPAMIVFGLPTWTMMHLFGSVHPGLGALVGGLVGAGTAALASMVLLPALSAEPVIALFGIPPGAAAGAILMWVAYRP